MQGPLCADGIPWEYPVSWSVAIIEHYTLIDTKWESLVCANQITPLLRSFSVDVVGKCPFFVGK